MRENQESLLNSFMEHGFEGKPPNPGNIRVTFKTLC
jgi:hypothetical protein